MSTPFLTKLMASKQFARLVHCSRVHKHPCNQFLASFMLCACGTMYAAYTCMVHKHVPFPVHPITMHVIQASYIIRWDGPFTSYGCIFPCWLMTHKDHWHRSCYAHVAHVAVELTPAMRTSASPTSWHHGIVYKLVLVPKSSALQPYWLITHKACMR